MNESQRKKKRLAAKKGRRKEEVIMWKKLLIRSEPPVRDPREMQTILTCSLRALFGDLEPHSCQISVSTTKDNDDKEEGGWLSTTTREKTTDTTKNDNDENGGVRLVVKCLAESMDAVRAALTMVTPPPYLESTLYRFDIEQIRESPQKKRA